MAKPYDLVIVGGGMVGAAIALGLADTGLRIALLERDPPEPFRADQPLDLRVSALSPASVALLERLGVWRTIRGWRTCPYQRMRVWELSEDEVGLTGDIAQRAATEFSCDELGLAELGFIVENRLIQRALLEAIAAKKSIDLITDGVVAIDYSPGASLVELEGDKTLVAKLLVAADGGHSMVRDAAALGVHQWDYEQMAMLVNVETELPQQDITWQQFTPSGPRALLPLPGNHASLVWYDAPARVAELLALDDAELKAQILAAFPKRLGGIRRIESRGAFALRRMHAQHYAKQGVVLAGDAAHQINPLAGQGVNLGFQDVEALIDLLSEAVARGESIESLGLLKRYEKQRRNANLLMMQTMDLFYRLFSNRSSALKLARNLVLGLAGAARPLRVKAMRIASGLERF